MASRPQPPHAHHRRLASRADFARAERIVIKCGTGVVTNEDGFPSLVRIANIVESAAKLVRAGKQVLIVSSGAVGIGRRKLRHQLLSRQSLADVLRGQQAGVVPEIVRKTNSSISYNSACAAAGQMGLVSLYETMFSQFDLSTSQLLVTAFDFTSAERKDNLQCVRGGGTSRCIVSRRYKACRHAGAVSSHSNNNNNSKPKVRDRGAAVSRGRAHHQ
jgi:hypothetical protein